MKKITLQTFSYFYRMSDNATAQAILNSVRKTIHTYSYAFADPNDQARIITGEEEGKFSWITSNYLSDTFGEVCIET